MFCHTSEINEIIKRDENDSREDPSQRRTVREALGEGIAHHQGCYQSTQQLGIGPLCLFLLEDQFPHRYNTDL